MSLSTYLRAEGIEEQKAPEQTVSEAFECFFL